MLELWLSIMDLAVSRSTSSAEILYWSKVVGADDGELVGLVVGALVGSDGELVVGAFDARTHSADDSEPLSLAQAVFHGASVQSKQAAPLNIQLWAESDARVREGKRRSRRATQARTLTVGDLLHARDAAHVPAGEVFVELALSEEKLPE